MRKFGLFVGAGALICLSVALVEGQQGGGKKGGGGFGNFKKTPVQVLADLLSRDEVKKELDLTDEQLEKLPAEVMVAFSKVLNEKQFKRFKQVDLQQRKLNAFKDATVQTELKITADQKKSLVSLIDDFDKERAETIKANMGKGGGFGKGGGGNEKITNLEKEYKEKVYTVLTKDQRAAYREMLGDELKLPPLGFGGFGGDKKGDTKKKDTE